MADAEKYAQMRAQLAANAAESNRIGQEWIRSENEAKAKQDEATYGNLEKLSKLLEQDPRTRTADDEQWMVQQMTDYQTHLSPQELEEERLSMQAFLDTQHKAADRGGWGASLINTITRRKS